MTLIIYDEEIPASVMSRIIALGAERFLVCGEAKILQTAVHTEELMRIVQHCVNDAPPPWQNATPYLKRKKGRS